MQPPVLPGPGLLLAAFPPELGELADHAPRGWVTGCVGVGLASAAAGAAWLIATHAPSKVLFIGTCGAYGPGLGIGACISVPEVRVGSLEELRGEAYRPAIERTRWSSGLDLPFPAHGVLNPPAITRTMEGAQALGTLADAEHLELAGVFEAARAAGIPVGAVLGVANRVGPQAHEEWKMNHAEVSRRLIALLCEKGVLG